MGKIPKMIEPYSKVFEVKAPKSICTQNKTSALNGLELDNFPKLLGESIIGPLVQTSKNRKSYEFGSPIAQHGIWQKNIASLSASKYAIESVAPLATNQKAHLQLLLASLAKSSIDSLAESMYGVPVGGDLQRLIQDVRRDIDCIYTRIFENEPTEDEIISGSDLIPLQSLPRVHVRFEMESAMLLDAFQRQLKHKGTADPRIWAVNMRKLYTSYVTLVRASESLSNDDPNHHAALLASRFSRQTVRALRDMEASEISSKTIIFGMSAFSQEVVNATHVHKMHPLSA